MHVSIYEIMSTRTYNESMMIQKVDMALLDPLRHLCYC